MTQKEIRKERRKEKIHERHKIHEAPRPDQWDETLNDSFPASDPPSHSGITSIVGRYPAVREEESQRPPSHQRGHDARPTGHPTWERHAVETAHCWEDEDIF